MRQHQARGPGLGRREVRRQRECGVLEVLVHRQHEEVRVLGSARGVPGAHAELHRPDARMRGGREGAVFVAAVLRVADAGREAFGVLPVARQRRAGLLAAETCREARGLRVEAAETRLHAGPVVRPARDDVDHAADRVRAVQRGARALDDLDAFDELRRDILERGGADRARVDAQAIHEHEHVVRFRAAHEDGSLLAGTAEARDLDARHEAQRIAEVGGRSHRQVFAGNEFHAGEHFPGGKLSARGGDDDRFEGGAAGGSGKQYQGVHPRSFPSGESKCSPAAKGYREGRAPGPALPVARRDWRCLTGRSPDSRLSASPSHRKSGSGCRHCLRDAACAVYRCGGSAGIAIARAPASRLARAYARGTCHRRPFWRGLCRRSSGRR